MNKKLPSLFIGEIEIKIPIVQGGMGVRVSTASLVSAVSNAGCLGTLASVGLGEFEKDIDKNYALANSRALKKEIRKTQKMTDNPFAVNVMVALTDYEALVETCVKEKIDVIITGTGLPFKLPEYVNRKETKLVPKISSDRAAYIICKKWSDKYNIIPDALMVEGPKSGGHQGFSFKELEDIEKYSLENIILNVIKVIEPFQKKYNKKISIIAAGGIYDGKDIAKMFKLGVNGVQLGSRFVCTNECDVSDEFKQAYINAKESDIVLIQSPVGLPARLIKNEFYNKIVQSGGKLKFSCPYHCLKTCDPDEAKFCIAKALLDSAKGNMKEGLVLCSTRVDKINKIIPVKELIRELTKEALANS